MVDLDLFLQRERLITQPLAWLDAYVVIRMLSFHFVRSWPTIKNSPTP
jgi:hypothetical protein